MYKNYELLGAYRDGSIDDINRLIEYDDRLVEEDVSTYSELLELLEKQYKECHKTIEAYNMLHKKLDNHYIEFSSFVK